MIVMPVLMLLTVRTYAANYYVNAAQAGDTGAGTNWTSAKKTIQAAVNQAASGDTVIVTNGIYNVGATVTPGYTLSNRVVILKAITVKSVNGPVVTIIDGPGTNSYNTSSAMRCVYMTNGVLDGFTLRGGTTKAGNLNDASAAWQQCGGGVNMNNSPLAKAQNCVISNCKANLGGGTYCGNFYNCLIISNTAGYGGGNGFGSLNNSTLSGNTATSQGGGSYYGGFNNCILWGNSGGSGGNYYLCDFVYSCTVPLPLGSGNISSDPIFVNAANGNFNLQSNSPCINTASNGYTALAIDLVGNPRIINEIVDMGAYEYPVISVTFNAQGGSVSPGVTNVACNATYGILPTPTRTGYTSAGWWTGAGGTGSQVTSATTVTVASAQTLYAKWTANSYTMYVTSPFGNAVPPVGSNQISFGSVVTASVTNSPFQIGSSTQYVCTGWTGIGSVPSIGVTTNTGSFTISDASSITWQWITNYWLEVAATGSGNIDRSNQWCSSGSNMTVVATPTGFNDFIGWAGETNNCLINGSQIIVPMNGSRNITALFGQGQGGAAGGAPIIISGFVVGISISDSGSGYTNAPRVRIIGDGTGAQAVAVVSNGVVTAVNMVTAGSGYTSNTIVVISPPYIRQPVADKQMMKALVVSTNLLIGQSYVLQALAMMGWVDIQTAFVASSSVYSVYTDQGRAATYRLAAIPVPPQAFAAAQIINGFIVGVTVTNGGAGYVTPPEVRFVAESGSNAIATASISGDAVSIITINNPGSGYTNGVYVQIDPPPAVAIVPMVTPALSVNYIRLSPYDNYQLEWCRDLAGAWGDFGVEVVPVATTNTLYIPATNSCAFFRIYYRP